MKSSVPLVLIIFALVCFALAQNTQAVSPPPDGGYPGGNTAEGQNALLSLTSGAWNTAVGFASLKSNNIGSLNTAVGVNALSLNTTGINNTANGGNALYGNTTGYQNTANGVYTLFQNTTGITNTATGAFALGGNTTGSANTAVGQSALLYSTTGSRNTAIGVLALNANLAGNNNTAVGHDAMFQTGGANFNTAVGAGALNASVGDFNTALGANAGADIIGANNIDIGANVYGVSGESNTIRIGNTDITDTFISGISGTTVASGAAVLVDSNGHLGTVTSSKRFKEDIKPMAKASEAILGLKPVTFQYKSDKTNTPQFGLVAEEVAALNPDLVVRDKNGEIYTVRYDQVNAMLLNEFLKEHRKVQEQEATITQLKKDFGATIAQLTTRLDQQAAQIQKVSAQLEANKPTPQVVANDQ